MVPSHGTMEPSPFGLGITMTVVVVVCPPGNVTTVVAGVGEDVVRAGACVVRDVGAVVEAGVLGFAAGFEQPEIATIGTTETVAISQE